MDVGVFRSFSEATSSVTPSAQRDIDPHPELLSPLRGVKRRYVVDENIEPESRPPECVHGQNAHFPRKRRFYVTDNKYWPVDQWWG